MKKISLLATVLLFCSVMSYGWGFFGHKVIHQLAIYGLPKQMQNFFYKHQDYLIEKAVRPDERRNEDPAEAPRHFIDIDVYGKDAVNTMPEEWKAATARYSTDTLLKYGIVPWHVVVMKERLTNAFRTQNADSILFYAADLGHYIADAHVPLHTTVNYDGQLTEQKGLHSLWESKVPEMNAQAYKLQNKQAVYLPNTEKAIWEVVRHTNSLVPQTLTLEREASKSFTSDTKFIQVERYGKMRQYYSDEFAKKYQELLGPMVEQQMSNAAQMVSNFWYTCWVDGGKPNLDKLLTEKISKAEKKELKKELKSWKNNKLFEDDKVIAAQKKD
ncbi:zinc dependent phospholipase C family protein [Pontibacter silvestris]|uniref:Zinc dependent phospholipase C family protein n=1 Tax=Pontibacter silvestris TaxID=2305183 RepID=A0ABW4WXI4_9BACT|nr:zinc dependent phospholipase C family protein [Pontibacter silvestris]MCC9137440.1 zinc dependent phospholipase C family protein [Pontibacter silvestris]